MALWPRGRLPRLGWLFVALCCVFAFGGQLLMELHGGAGERGTSFDPRHAALLVATVTVALLGCRGLRILRAQADGDRDFHWLLKQSLSELPFKGRGAGFFLTIAMATFGIGLLATSASAARPGFTMLSAGLSPRSLLPSSPRSARVRGADARLDAAVRALRRANSPLLRMRPSSYARARRSSPTLFARRA